MQGLAGNSINKSKSEKKNAKIPQRDNPGEITLCYLTGQALRYPTGQAL